MVRIALTMGDPAGIGPELCVRAAAAGKKEVEFIVYGVESVIREAAERFADGRMPRIEPVPPCGAFQYGKADPGCGRAAYDTLTRATYDALSQRVDAIVTAPMNKYSVNLSGIPFTGHTERIAELCGVKDFAMMQSAGDLRVVFATTHIALAEVPRVLTFERIVKVGELLNGAVKAEGVASPRLAAAALNPHAGENGCMGHEDEEVVKPALARLRELGIEVEGPFPPDVLFIESVRSKFDGIIAMYHDQGHIPFKMLAFDRGVNSTLGLPVIRTSPDHGTAFDIAWRGTADSGSFDAAIELAVRRARNRIPAVR